MSALGHKRTKRHLGAMSALPPKADKQQMARFVRFVPKATECTATNSIEGPPLAAPAPGPLTGGKRHYEDLPSYTAARRLNVNTPIAARPAASSIHGARSLSNWSSNFEIWDNKRSQRGLGGMGGVNRNGV